MKPLRSASEHRHFACAVSADFHRCMRSSRLQTRWAHRLKVYVPSCALACICWVSSAFAQTNTDFTKANEEYAQGHFTEESSAYEALPRAGQWSAKLFY